MDDDGIIVGVRYIEHVSFPCRPQCNGYPINQYQLLLKMEELMIQLRDALKPSRACQDVSLHVPRAWVFSKSL
jgi:hypothetical protein